MTRTETMDRSTFSADRPLYRAVRDEIVKGLVAGEWKPREALPSEARLAERFQVSIPTVRAAIAELAAAKVLMRRQGKGTFVASHNHHNVYQFFHMTPDAGPKALPRFRLLSFARSTAGSEVSQLLQLGALRASARVIEFTIVLSIDDTPVMLSDITVSQEQFPGLSEKVIREGGDTIYGIYQSGFGITVTHTTDQIRAVSAPAAVARQVGVSRGDPVLRIHRVGYTLDGLPAEVRVSHARSDRYHYLLRQGGPG